MVDVYGAGPDFRIVAGGQTGADVAGLDWAMDNGVAHGGWCPKGRKTEDGPLPPQYALIETPLAAYLQRTEWNVRDSDATVVFTMTDKIDGGSKRTVEFAEALGKPLIHMRPGVHPKYLARFLDRHQVKVLNVAGKRESGAPGISRFVIDMLAQAIRIDAPAAVAAPGEEGSGGRRA